ncbi:MAG: ABC transporter substrate-binding protein [Leifsonia sp.]
MSTKTSSGWKNRKLTARTTTVAVVAAALVLTGCAGQTQSAGDSLTYAASIAPTSLDPVITNNNPDDIVYQEAAYASLLRRDVKGQLEGDLATKWGYVGDGNKKFDLTLRSGAKFADGTPVDAKSVAASLNYFIKNTTGPSAGAVPGMSASATGSNEVVIESTVSNPVIPELLTSYNLLGTIISPAGLKNPEQLKTKTFGAGPYTLDPAQTVTGDHYTYTRNDNYYDNSVKRPKTLVIKVIAKANSALESLRSGQVNLMYGDKSLASTAKGYGVQIFAQPHSFAGFLLADRAGNLVPALGQQKVRQALNYAIDRGSIAQAAVGEYGTATTQPNLPGWDSYSKSFESMYAYDPAKAKALLAEAGYPNGFSMKIAYAAWEPVDVTVVQAMASQLAKVGVAVDLVSTTSGSQLFGGLADKQYSGISLTWGGQPFAANYGSLWAANGSANPWKVTVPGLEDAYAAYEAAAPDALTDSAVAAQQVVMDQAATVSAVQVDAIAFASKGVSGFALDSHGVLTNVADWSAAK